MNIRLKVLLLATVPLIIIIMVLSILMKFQYERLSKQQIKAYQTSLYEQKDIELKNYTQLALSAITPFIENSDKNKVKAQDEAKAVLTSLAYSNDGYFFVYDLEGNGIVHPTQPYRVGENWIGLQDTIGNFVIQDLIKLSQSGGGFYTYRWNNPATQKDAEKRSYTLPINSWGWFIGTGIYLNKIDEQIAFQKEEFNKQIRRSLLRNAVFSSIALLSVFGLVFYMNFQELGYADKRLRVLNKEILNAQEDERRRVSRELHDSISQMLVSIKYAFEHASLKLTNVKTQKNSKKISEIQLSIEQGLGKLLDTTKEVRRISHALRPSQLDDLGLGPALENLAREFEERTHISTTVIAPRFKGSLPEDTKIALYRISQEALTNIQRHAHAHHVEINVIRGIGMITLSIKDNGIGFNVAKLNSKTDPKLTKMGLGLTNIAERAETRGGHLEIITGASGTLLTIEFPVNYLPCPPPSIDIKEELKNVT